MDANVYGWIIAMMAFAMIILLAFLGQKFKEVADLRDKNRSLWQAGCGHQNVIRRRQEIINTRNKDLKSAAKEIEQLREDLRLAKEETAYVNETLREQEELLRERDVELGYNEQYMASQQHVLELSQQEIDDLHRKLKAAQAPEHLKACLLEKIQECGNLRHLNELLENANASYAADVKLIKTEFQAMMARINATEFDQIRFPFTYPASEMDDMNKEPDLGPETCTSQEPQEPADSMETQQVSACF